MLDDGGIQEAKAVNLSDREHVLQSIELLHRVKLAEQRGSSLLEQMYD